MKLSACSQILHLQGCCDYKTSKKFKFSSIPLKSQIQIDCSALEKMDFSFAIFLDENLKKREANYELINADIKVLEIFSLIASRNNFKIQKHKKNLFYRLGEWVCQKWEGFLDFLNFFGLFVFALLRTFCNPKLLRFRALLYHIYHSGFKALPVGIVTCAIVSGAITLQGVLQLEKMGVPLASVETMAKLSLREMGPFILALVIAGRSASAFTAQIGVMRITEELDAMRVMGFDWYQFNILPRFLALVIVMPLLVFVADGASLFVSAVVIKLQTGITFSQYVERFYENVGIVHLWIGVIKSPFFGAAIALVGCYRGLEIEGNTQSVGKYTTLSVVNALFWIIVVNAIFSVIFTRFNL